MFSHPDEEKRARRHCPAQCARRLRGFLEELSHRPRSVTKRVSRSRCHPSASPTLGLPPRPQYPQPRANDSGAGDCPRPARRPRPSSAGHLERQAASLGAISLANGPVPSARVRVDVRGRASARFAAELGNFSSALVSRRKAKKGHLAHRINGAETRESGFGAALFARKSFALERAGK